MDKMDFEEFKAAVMADPSFADREPETVNSDERRAFVAEVKALDNMIREAMQVDAPELKTVELPPVEDKVVSLDERRKPRFKAPVWLAMAATVTFAAVLGVRGFLAPTDPTSIADQILAHMDHEPYSRVVSTTPVSDSRLERVVPSNVANLSHDAGLITYAQSCEVNGNVVPHLVIQGEHGPVTVILLPEEKIDGPVNIGDEQFHGVLLPVGDGSIAILGEDKDEDFGRIRESLERSVAWRT